MVGQVSKKWMSTKLALNVCISSITRMGTSAAKMDPTECTRVTRLYAALGTKGVTLTLEPKPQADTAVFLARYSIELEEEWEL